jgi:hypothetical protein
MDREFRHHFGDKWSDVFHYFKAESISVKNITYLVQFSFETSRSSNAMESTFSLLNAVWSGDKKRLKLEIVNSVMLIKVTFQFLIV